MRNPPEERRWPAWLVSVVCHTLVLAVALLALERRPRGAAEQASRDVGIVLRRQDDSVTRYQGDDPQEQPQAAQKPPSQPVLERDALPDESLSTLAEHLPSGQSPLELLVEGVGPAANGSPGGGAPPPGAMAAGGQARVSVFGVAGEGHKFVYAFDRSVSMTGAPLAAAKQQLLESLQSLGATHQFQILFFNHRLTAFDLTAGRNRIAFANDQTREAARRFVDTIAADGGTDRYQALRRALAMEPDVVFFLTDADDAMTGGELARIESQNARVGATICSIEFGRGPSTGKDNFLKELARRTGGQYGYVDTTRLMR